MTSPDPMSVERALRRLNEFAAGERGPYTGLVSDIDALTARIAELEHYRETREKEAAGWSEELAAGRKPPDDGEVAVVVEAILKCELTRDEAHAAADLLARLSAARKEAERVMEWSCEKHGEIEKAQRDSYQAKLETARRDALEEAAQACRKEVERARDLGACAKALGPAAELITSGREDSATRILSVIRALQQKDTAP